MVARAIELPATTDRDRAVLLACRGTWITRAELMKVLGMRQDAVFTALYRLGGRGLVVNRDLNDTDWEDRSRSRNRIYYRTTPEGDWAIRSLGDE